MLLQLLLPLPLQLLLPQASYGAHVGSERTTVSLGDRATMAGLLPATRTLYGDGGGCWCMFTCWFR